MSEIAEIYGDARIAANLSDPITYGDGSLTILGNLFINGGIDFGQGTNITTGSTFLLLVGDNNQLNFGSKNIIVNGDLNNINGININIFGSTNIVSGENHTVIGTNNTVAGLLNLVVGRNIITSDNNNAFVVGETINSSGNNQMMIGSNLNNDSPGGISMGRSSTVSSGGSIGNSTIGRNNLINAPLSENNLMIGQQASFIFPVNNTITLGPDPVVGGNYIGGNADSIRPGSSNSITMSAQNGIYFDSGSGLFETSKISYHPSVTQNDITDPRHLASSAYLNTRAASIGSIYTRVGPFETYTTIRDAIIDGKTNLAVVANTTETISVDLNQQGLDVHIFIEANVTVTYSNPVVSYFDSSGLFQRSLYISGPGQIIVSFSLGPDFILGLKQFSIKNLTFQTDSTINQTEETLVKFTDLNIIVDILLPDPIPLLFRLGPNSILENINIQATRLENNVIILSDYCILNNIIILSNQFKSVFGPGNDGTIFVNGDYCVLNNISVFDIGGGSLTFFRNVMIGLNNVTNIKINNCIGSFKIDGILDFINGGIGGTCTNTLISNSAFGVTNNFAFATNLTIKDCILSRYPSSVSGGDRFLHNTSGYINLINSFVFSFSNLNTGNITNPTTFNIYNCYLERGLDINNSTVCSVSFINNIIAGFLTQFGSTTSALTNSIWLNNIAEVGLSGDSIVSNFAINSIMCNNTGRTILLGNIIGGQTNFIMTGNVGNFVIASTNIAANGNIMTSNRGLNLVGSNAVNPPEVFANNI